MELPERESLKRQIETIKREIKEREEDRERSREARKNYKPMTFERYGKSVKTPRFRPTTNVSDEIREAVKRESEARDLQLTARIDEMREVLATLEGLMPLAY